MKLAIVLALVPLAIASQARVESTVGMPARVEQVVLPAPELEAAPVDPKSPILLRVTGTWPHGTDFRYDLEYQGFEPGDYDLARWLVRKDGGAAQALPAIPVTVRALLPADVMTPHQREAGSDVSLGGYRVLMIVAGVAWLLGLVLLLRWIRPPRPAAIVATAKPRTLAERLRPLVQRALENELTRAERAQLELVLVGVWKRKLELDGLEPARALSLLRNHADAGPLIRALEDWLHRPEPPKDVDLEALLAPYRDLPAEAFEREEAGARA
jgi:hypothetical protein